MSLCTVLFDQNEAHKAHRELFPGQSTESSFLSLSRHKGHARTHAVDGRVLPKPGQPEWGREWIFYSIPAFPRQVLWEGKHTSLKYPLCADFTLLWIFKGFSHHRHRAGSAYDIATPATFLSRERATGTEKVKSLVQVLRRHQSSASKLFQRKPFALLSTLVSETPQHFWDRVLPTKMWEWVFFSLVVLCVHVKEKHKDSLEPQGCSGPSWAHSCELTRAPERVDGTSADWVLEGVYGWWNLPGTG